MAGRGFKRSADFHIFGDVGARRRRDLHQDHAVAQVVVTLQEVLEGVEPFHQSLAVVQPVHPDDEVPAPKAFLETRGAARPLRLLGEGGDVVGVDADGECLGPGRPAKGPDPVVVEQLAVALVKYVVAKLDQIAFGLEADQVIGQERADQCLVAGKGGQDLMGGKRGVEEEPDGLFDAGAAQRVGHHHEVIVVDPDDVARLEKRHQGGGKTGIDPLVGVEILAREYGEIEAVME